MKQMPKEITHMYIIDPKSLQRLKCADGYDKPLSLENQNCYVKKFQGLVFNIAMPQSELSNFIDDFLDDKLRHHYVNLDRSQSGKVKWINTESFEKEIINNDKVEQCVIEVIKDHCPACFISKINTNVIS